MIFYMVLHVFIAIVYCLLSSGLHLHQANQFKSWGVIVIDKYWLRIMEIMEDDGDFKYCVISKVVKCCLSIAEANASVERLFSQVTHILQKDRNRLTIETVKGLLYCKEKCTDVNIDENMIYNAKVAHSRYTEKMTME